MIMCVLHIYQIYQYVQYMILFLTGAVTDAQATQAKTVESTSDKLVKPLALAGKGRPTELPQLWCTPEINYKWNQLTTYMGLTTDNVNPKKIKKSIHLGMDHDGMFNHFESYEGLRFHPAGPPWLSRLRRSPVAWCQLVKRARQLGLLNNLCMGMI